MKAILFCICLLACAAVVAAHGDEKESKPHPDLSGTWTLDNAKSDFGPFRDRPLAKAKTRTATRSRRPSR
ncbi:MAG: hypothetical protein M3348_17095 [Acidobacteriota bacterium]|nr:hypothetical protein [Acidobacteriota bacterium]